MKMFHVNSVLLVFSMLAGFLAPYWIFHHFFWIDDLQSRWRRAVRSNPGLFFTLNITELDFLVEQYFVESDATFTGASQHSENWLVVRVMSKGHGTSYIRPEIRVDFIHLKPTDGVETQAQMVIREVCRTNRRHQHTWTVLVDGTTYVNTFMLRHFLRRLPTSTPALIGKGVENATDLCTLDPGIILNTAAIQIICGDINPEDVTTCDAESNVYGINTCLMAQLGVGCTDITQKIPAFYRRLEDCYENDGHLSREFAFNTAFVGNNLTSDNITTIHRHILFVRAEALRQSRRLFWKSRDTVVSTQRPKRESENELVTSKRGFPLPRFLRNESELPDSAYLFVDSDGFLHRRNCVASVSDAVSLIRMSPSYLQTMAVANESIQNADRMYTFAFSLTKPNFGREYHVYYVEETSEHDLVQSYEVITSQQYNRPKTKLKSVVPIRPLVVLVSLPSGTTDIGYVVRGVLGAVEGTGMRKTTILLQTSSNETDDVIKQRDSADIRFINRHSTSLIDELSRFGKNAIFVHIPQNVIIQHPFLLRCFLRAEYGVKAYFPIPFHRSDAQRLSDLSPTNESYSWIVDEGGRWETSNFSVHCAAVGDIMDVLKSRLDASDSIGVYARLKANLQIIRQVDKDVLILRARQRH